MSARIPCSEVVGDIPPLIGVVVAPAVVQAAGAWLREQRAALLREVWLSTRCPLVCVFSVHAVSGAPARSVPGASAVGLQTAAMQHGRAVGAGAPAASFRAEVGRG